MEMFGGNTLSKAELITSTLNLLKYSEKMGLRVNEIKTKYMIVTRKQTVMQSLRVGPYLFEQVADFKYLGVNLND